MTMTMITIAICSAIIAVAFAVVLAGEDSPLNFWFDLVSQWRDRGGWQSWIASPLGGCEKCLAGQLGLWSSIALNGGHSFDAIFMHAATASAAILLAVPIAHAYRWLKRKI